MTDRRVIRQAEQVENQSTGLFPGEDTDEPTIGIDYGPDFGPGSAPMAGGGE